MQTLSKLFYIFTTFALTLLLAAVGYDTWRSHEHIRLHGAEGALVVGLEYNASRWATPLPLKKLHVYTATLAPGHEVVIETDQTLAPRQKLFIRHLSLGDEGTASSFSHLRPVSGRIRLRAPTDGSPAPVSTTAPLEKAVDLAMGTKQAPAGPAGGAPDRSLPTAAFVIGGANDGALELIWNNSRAGEWALLAFALFLLQAFAINAWTLPWRDRRPSDEEKDFVHPSLKTVEPDAPLPPVKRIAFTPKPKTAEPPAAGEQPAEERALRLPRK